MKYTVLIPYQRYGGPGWKNVVEWLDVMVCRDEWSTVNAQRSASELPEGPLSPPSGRNRKIWVGWEFSFNDPDIAMLFKLTWCGRLS